MVYCCNCCLLMLFFTVYCCCFCCYCFLLFIVVVFVVIVFVVSLLYLQRLAWVADVCAEYDVREGWHERTRVAVDSSVVTRTAEWMR